MSGTCRTSAPDVRPGAGAARRSPEAEELAAPRGPLGVAMPAYQGRSVANLLPRIAAALGRELSDPRLPPLDPRLDPFAGRRAEGPVVLGLVDGLGYASLLRAGELRKGAAARRWAGRTRPITTVFPSGTPVALTSVSTGAAPAQHGVVGYRQFLPRFGSVVEVLRMSPVGLAAPDALVGPGWRPSELTGVPTCFCRGLSAVAVSRDRFEGTGFTRTIYEGARYAPYATFSDLAHEVRRLLASDAPPELVLLYWDELDLAMHLRGPDPALAAFEIDRLDALLRWVADGLPAARAARTTVLLSADHGLVPNAPASQLEVEKVPALVELLGRPPAGDRRAAFFRARTGSVDRLARLLGETLGATATVCEAGAAIDAGLFGPGPFHPELAERIGDLVVLPRSPGGIGYRLPGAAPARRFLKGAHGGVEPDELLVPLVAGPLAGFAGDARGPAERGRGPRPKR